ncbi:hypothetical protein P7K49_040630, partial [Saguinus oedipus]
SWGFLYEYLKHCPAQLEVVYSLFACRGSALLAQVLPAAAGLHSAVVRYALLTESLCYGGLPQQRQVASALGSTSVGADCICSGRRPSPTGLHCSRFN